MFRTGVVCTGVTLAAMATKPENKRKGSFFFPRSKSKSNAAAGEC